MDVRKALLVALLLHTSSFPVAAAISFDPSLGNACVKGLEGQTPVTEAWYQFDCSLSSGNNMQINSNQWSRASPYSFQPNASNYLPSCSGINGEGKFYLEYQSGNFMYGGAKDCRTAVTGPLTAIAHAQTVQSAMFPAGIPSNLKLYDSNHPRGYRLTAQFALNGIGWEPGQAGFARAALIFHLYAPNATQYKHIFVEFDAYDSPNVSSYSDAGTVWVTMPTYGGDLFQRRQFFWGGTNVSEGAWHTLYVDSSEVGAILGRYRPDVNQADVQILQVYTALELGGAYGHLNTRLLSLDYLP